jgi:hypothetical protein
MRYEQWNEKLQPNETLEYDPADPAKWWRPRLNPFPPVLKWALDLNPALAYNGLLCFLLTF